MKSIVAVIALFVLLCGSGFAQATNYKEESHFIGIFSASCSDEPVAAIGTLITNIHTLFNGSVGQVQFHTTEGPTSNGVGLVSGAPYKVKVNQFDKFVLDSGVISDIALRHKFVLQGPSDLVINYIMRARFDTATGQFKTSFEKSDINCK